MKELYFYDNRKLLASRGGGQTLGTILAKCSALEKINLKDTGMTEEALVAFAEACGQLPALKERDFNVFSNRTLLASRGAGQSLGTLLA